MRNSTRNSDSRLRRHLRRDPSWSEPAPKKRCLCRTPYFAAYALALEIPAANKGAGSRHFRILRLLWGRSLLPSSVHLAVPLRLEIEFQEFILNPLLHKTLTLFMLIQFTARKWLQSTFTLWSSYKSHKQVLS